MDDPQNPETPWSVAKRMRAEGHSHELIVGRLKQMHLEDADIEVLLLEAPPRRDGDDGTDDIVKVGAMILAGPILGHFIAGAISGRAEEPVELAPQVPLSAEDRSSRCAWHIDLASVATCPRCGKFTCRECAPAPRGKMCMHCAASPVAQRVALTPAALELQNKRVRRASNGLSWAIWAVMGLGLFETRIAADNLVTAYVVRTALFCALPFAVLGFVQRWSRRIWPGLLAGAYALLVLMVGTRLPGYWLFSPFVLLPAIFALLYVRRDNPD